MLPAASPRARAAVEWAMNGAAEKDRSFGYFQHRSAAEPIAEIGGGHLAPALGTSTWHQHLASGHSRSRYHAADPRALLCLSLADRSLGERVMFRRFIEPCRNLRRGFS